jgi:hypothetical protein
MLRGPPPPQIGHAQGLRGTLGIMSEHRKDQPTQKTPQGHEIPVPTRKQVLRDLEKVAKPKPKKAERHGE